MRYTQTPTPSFTSTPSNTPTYTPTNTASSTSCPGLTPTPTPSTDNCPTCYSYVFINNDLESSCDVTYILCDEYEYTTRTIGAGQAISVCICKDSYAFECPLDVIEGEPCIPPSATPTRTPTRTPTPTPTPTTYPCVNCILYSVYNPNDEVSQELSYVPCGSINPITINVAGGNDIDVCACAGSLAYEGNLIVNQQGLCSPPPPTPTPSPTSNPCVVCRTYDIYNPSETTGCEISYIACGSSSYTTITVAPGDDTSICACTDSLAYECDLVVINSGACNPE